MNGAFSVSPQSLASTIRQIADGLLSRRFEDKAKSYVKMDFNAINDNQCFVVQITMCSSMSTSNLKFILTAALRRQLSDVKESIAKRSVIAVVEEKRATTLRLQKVVCTRYSSISLVHQDDLELCLAQKEFSLLKRYVSIKLLFQVDNAEFDTFASLLTCHIIEIEQTDPNIKFSFRKNNSVYIYRNHVRMDDIILSCMLLSSFCANVFHRSQDDQFRDVIERALELRKPGDLEKTVGCLLLARTDGNFITPMLESRKNEE